MLNSCETDSPERLQAMLQAQSNRRGFSLDNFFYQSGRVYQRELERLLFRSWVYAAHISELPNVGDFVLFELADDSIIISKDRAGKIHALHNICRHRGSRVCQKESGNSSTFTCPYHGWVYENDGKLRAPRESASYKELDTKNYGLKPIAVEIFEGLIFINFNSCADSFQTSLTQVGAQLGAYDLARAKIAHQETYRISANWKLCLENYLECYHCASSHKFYARSHTLKELENNVAILNDEMLARTEKITGVSGIGQQLYKVYQTADSFGACISHNRYALYSGYQTGSETGAPVAPLMGSMQGFDGGAGDFQFGPVSFMLNYPDYCVLYRFVPRGLQQTDMTLVWFVREDAEQGKDYDIEKLTWLWHQTSLEDKHIIMQNSAGVKSMFYEPGPCHPEFESLLLQFIDWYVSNLGNC